jgi:hypothetical protein
MYRLKIYPNILLIKLIRTIEVSIRQALGFFMNRSASCTEKINKCVDMFYQLVYHEVIAVMQPSCQYVRQFQSLFMYALIKPDRDKSIFEVLS